MAQSLSCSKSCPVFWSKKNKQSSFFQDGKCKINTQQYVLQPMKYIPLVHITVWLADNTQTHPHQQNKYMQNVIDRKPNYLAHGAGWRVTNRRNHSSSRSNRRQKQISAKKHGLMTPSIDEADMLTSCLVTLSRNIGRMADGSDMQTKFDITR